MQTLLDKNLLDQKMNGVYCNENQHLMPVDVKFILYLNSCVLRSTMYTTD